jgi:diguanylate cyclase (GGDEF)-like protein
MADTILLVDDDPAMIRIMGRILSGLGGTLRFATDGVSALQQAREHPIDLILLDAEMPGMTGYQVCDVLKADPELRDVPVIIVTANSAVEFELRGLALGAVDFIAKPISELLLLARVRTQLGIKRLTDELRRLATIDALTELRNRRSFDEALTREWNRGLRGGDPISLLMIDIDHFKLLNDRYGHPTGDLFLRTVAQALPGACLRPADIVARYGGEEFTILLPQTRRAGAEHVATRVLDAVESLGIPHEGSPTASCVTVSVGVGSFDGYGARGVRSDGASGFRPPWSFEVSHLSECADRALYAAKRSGRARAWSLDVSEMARCELGSEVPSSATRRDAPS